MEYLHNRALLKIGAEGDAQRLQAANRSAEAEIVKAKENLQYKKDILDQNKVSAAGLTGEPKRQADNAIAEDEKGVANEAQRIADAEAQVGRDRLKFSQDTNRAMLSAQASSEGARLNSLGRFADATKATLKNELAERLVEMDRAEKEELRTHDASQAGKISLKYAAQRNAANQQAQNAGRSAELDEFSTYQRINDMKLDFGTRMAQRGKPSYTFQAESVDAGGGTGIGDMFKAKESHDRQALDMQREARDYARQMRDAMISIQQKMLQMAVAAA